METAIFAAQEALAPSQIMPELMARSGDWLKALERKYRVTGSETDRKMALCAIAETMSYFDAAQNGQGALRYASVGSVSISGKGIYHMLDISPAAQEKELYRAAGRYLEIYRGIEDCGIASR